MGQGLDAMTETENLVLQHLPAIREQLGTLNERTLELCSALAAWNPDGETSPFG